MRIIKFGLLLIIVSTKVFGQDTLWKTKVINRFLTLQLPTNFQYNESSFIKGFVGEVNTNYYGLQYYDTTFLQVDNDETFQTSLIGFMSGRAEDSSLRRYDILVIDTTIGGTKGLFATFSTTDTSESYKHLYYFVTLANNQYYWFYVYSSVLNQSKKEMDFFFKSIKFDSAKLKERLFKLTPVHLVKKAD